MSTKPTHVKQAAALRTRIATCPTILQMEAVECGAASLAMILGHHGLWVPLEELRDACGVSRDGSKASNVVKAARRYGMIAKGFKKGMDNLGELTFPVIVFWNFNHYLVLEGFKGGKAYLRDPARGRRVVDIQDFDESFTGVVLSFERGDDFRKGGNSPNVIKALASRIKGSEAALVFVVLAGLGLVIPGLVIPIFAKIFVDNILVGQMQDWFKPLLLGMGITALLRGILVWMQEYYLLRFETKLALNSSGRFLWHILRLPMSFFTQRHSAEIGSRVAINDRIASLLSGELATTFINCFLIVFYAVIMMYYDAVLTLVGIATAAVNIVVLVLVNRMRVDQNMKLQKDSGKFIGVTIGGLRNIETLKATGGESDFFATWSGYQANLLNTRRQLEASLTVVGVVPVMLTGLNTVAVLTFGALRVMDGHLTIGMLVAFQSLMAGFIAPVNQMVQMGGALQDIKAGMARIDDVFRYQLDPAFGDAAIAIQEDDKSRLTGRLEVRELSFGYSRLDPPLVQDFSLRLQPGARVALVGFSGSGKSTIAKVVAGLYRPWAGTIFFDGRPRDDITRAIVNTSVAVVDQDIFMFEGTVKDNLTLWDSTIPESDLVQAAKDACIHDEITARVGGYDFIVTEGGGNFSGGQLQRLEIARALAINPTILILDEATSALDPVTEQRVDDNIRRRGCTCLIVAHRLSTIRDCDEIIMLDNGKVVQRGTHEEMSQAEGPYRQLIEVA